MLTPFPYLLKHSLLGFVIYLAACTSDSNGEIALGEIAFTDISKGEYSLDGSENVIKRFSLLNDQNIFSNIYTKYQDDEVPEIDFAQSQVIAAEMGTHNSGGHSINVNKIVEYENYISVQINTTVPGKSCLVDLAISSPYHFVTIAKQNKEIIFEESIIVDPCDPG